MLGRDIAGAEDFCRLAQAIQHFPHSGLLFTAKNLHAALLPAPVVKLKTEVQEKRTQTEGHHREDSSATAVVSPVDGL